MLNVAIDVDTAVAYGPQAVWAVAAACEEVIGEDRCPVATALEPGAVTAWYALVHPSDRELSSVRIDFRDRTAGGVLIEQRFLDFSQGDSQESRLASVGSVIAALAAAREGSPMRAPQKRRVDSAPPPVVQSAAPHASADFCLDVAALVAPTVDDGPTRLGGLARANVGLSKHAFGLLSGRYATFTGNPGFTWWTASAGVGLRSGDPSARFGLELTAEGVLEHTTIAATRGARRESATENGWGGRVGAAAIWALSSRTAVVLGADGAVVLPRINVIVGDQTTSEISLLSLGLHLGLRFRP